MNITAQDILASFNMELVSEDWGDLKQYVDRETLNTLMGSRHFRDLKHLMGRNSPTEIITNFKWNNVRKVLKDKDVLFLAIKYKSGKTAVLANDTSNAYNQGMYGSSRRTNQKVHFVMGGYVGDSSRSQYLNSEYTIESITSVKIDQQRLSKHKDRVNSRVGVVPLPNSREYNTFIQGMKTKFEIRVRKAIESKLENYENQSQLISTLTSKLPEKFKFQGIVFDKRNIRIGDIGKNKDKWSGGNYIEYQMTNNVSVYMEEFHPTLSRKLDATAYYNITETLPYNIKFMLDFQGLGNIKLVDTVIEYGAWQ